MLPPIQVRSNVEGLNSSADKSSFDGSGLIPNEVDPLEFGVPCGLISHGHLNQIITRYHILLDFICRVPNHDEYVSTLGPLEVTCYEEAFKVSLKILLHHFVALFL